MTQPTTSGTNETGAPDDASTVAPPEPQPAVPQAPRPATFKDLFKAQDGTKIVAMIMLALAIMYTVYFAKPILLPIFLALLLAILLLPLVKLICKIGIPQTLGAFIVVGLLTSTVTVGSYQLAGPALEYLDFGPNLGRSIERKLADLKLPLQKAREASEKIAEMAQIDQKGRQAPRVVVMQESLAETLAAHVQSSVTTGIITVVLLFFLLAEGPRSINRIVEAMELSEQRRRTKRVFLEIQWKISVYLRTVTLINIALGLLTSGLMWALGMPSPLLWGVIAGMFNFLPYVGPVITAVIIAIVSLMTFDSLLLILMPPLGFYILTAMEGQVITPMILGRQLTLNPILVFGTVLLWGWLWGVPGALLAVPILAIGKIILTNLEDVPAPLRAAME
ncbi:MAG: AI-2E family transporter [Alphaproteobacteria bacterium]|nr:AI-2E family transporter [Alphaproteobacteria bacterium]MBU0797552.1 AI-2E family transporter [Alphaproteobacteria bacterium]MBU0885883.1 AI-2E family transporter [Alphaproteobacteria bacterium]MBU1814617.1 AI-2E family transporter [Alphaproteobacteria bacterium]MBU2089521.1 AI-2E family transporter [Alphaproteobacteria bacterium]